MVKQMREGSIPREEALRDSSRQEHNLKPPKSVWIILVVWFLAIGSLLGIQYFFKKKPPTNKKAMMKIEAKLKSLTDEQKIRLKYFESGILESGSRDFFIIDSAMENNEIEKRGLSLRRIEFDIDDPLFLERQMMVREAFKRLNNAEKRCVMDRHAVILYRDGAYYLIYDSEINKEYVIKYGTECKSCEKKKEVKKSK
jgi:hypothetical protein